MKSVGGGRRKIEPYATVVETKFVRHGRTKRVSVAEGSAERLAGEAVVKSWQHADYAVSVESRIIRVAVVKPAEAERLSVRGDVINSNLMIVVRNRSGGHANEKAGLNILACARRAIASACSTRSLNTDVGKRCSAAHRTESF